MLVFEERGKPEFPEKHLSEQSREPTNSAHIWRRVRESNPGHIGGRRALSPLRQPCSPVHCTDNVTVHAQVCGLFCALFIILRGFIQAKALTNNGSTLTKCPPENTGLLLSEIFNDPLIMTFKIVRVPVTDYGRPVYLESWQILTSLELFLGPW